MKNCSRLTQPRCFSMLIAAVFLVVGLLPAAAFAESPDKLTCYLPSTTEMVVGFNVSKLSKSKHYKEVLTWLRSSGADERVMKVLEDADLDLSSDLDAMAISIPTTADTDATAQRHFTLAVSGSFNSDKLLTALKNSADIEEEEKEDTTLYSSDELDFSFPKKGVLWVTAGPDKYRTEAFQALGSDEGSMLSNKGLKALMGEVDTARGFWMVGDTSKLEATNAPSGPQPKSIGMSMDIHKGLALDLLAELPSEKDVKGAVAQVDALKAQDGQEAMLSMFGAKPLLSNLKTKQDGTKLHASTTMTTDEFDVLIQRVKQMAKSQAGGSGTMPMPNQPAPGQTAPSQPAPNQDKGGSGSSSGADADFN